MKLNKVVAVAAICLGWLLATCRASEPEIAFHPELNQLRITCGGKPLATYVIGEDEIPRPFFMAVHAPAGVQVTRNHPPREGEDLADHSTFHPGIWLAFGDLSGADFWRNKAHARHVEFVEPPRSGAGRGTFAVKNHYEAGGRMLCEEICRFVITTTPQGYLLDWDSTFSAIERPMVFGDQEEMGLGVRVATPLAVRNGGEIRSSDGLINEAEVWGKQADWCQYSGTIDQMRVGMAIMPDPENFRRSWFHARDYGLLVANPFGRQAFTDGKASRVVVRPGKPLRLRFGVLIFGDDGEQPTDVQAAYRRFVKARRK